MKKATEVIQSGRVFKAVIGDISYDKKSNVSPSDYIVYQRKKGPDGRINDTGNKAKE